jgi:hypothetical protein
MTLDQPFGSWPVMSCALQHRPSVWTMFLRSTVHGTHCRVRSCKLQRPSRSCETWRKGGRGWKQRKKGNPGRGYQTSYLGKWHFRAIDSVTRSAKVM